ncbi:alpha/beta hydrolase [Pelagicoccus sp. SDUM812003]|uniref:alpha/beta fold hydrolase n=1 Tax=Pelagicoccus sp. SDUM812003 TaxID=3041267 RepID=UPI002810419D|nr:alpha/beta hydrolase [Pelagicoccus sp. SDUM812003]MDQ8201767.1 alpha/beta hydrolase [Pelagicoccus sp. SDUM812003]
MVVSLSPLSWGGDLKKAASESPETFVLVHGAWGGGWDWQGMERLLEAEGHRVYRAHLTGHGQRAHLASPEIDLSLHIEDVIALIEWEQLQDVSLVGHSYGGMVITGVADRVPERLNRLIYLDAIVPEHGESVNSAFGRDGEENAGPGIEENGFSIPPWVSEGAPIPHDVPHSLKCFSEALTLRNEARFDVPTTYLYYIDPGMSEQEDAFYPFFRRAKEYEWKAVALPDWDHNAHRTHPQELLELLLSR